MRKSVFGVVRSQEQAQRLVNDLLNNGFQRDGISVLVSDTEGVVRKDVVEKHTKAAEGAASGGVTGGIIGGLIGLLAGIGSIAIPGLGMFVAAGPILGALSGSGVGGGIGLLLGSLIGLGVPEYEAKHYEERLKAGNALISVHCENDRDEKKAKELFEKAHAEDITCVAEDYAAFSR